MSAHAIIFGSADARARWRAARALPAITADSTDARVCFCTGGTLDLIVVSAPIELYRLRAQRWDSFEIDETALEVAPGTGLDEELARLLDEATKGGA